jgi:hypothetical protein
MKFLNNYCVNYDLILYLTVLTISGFLLTIIPCSSSSFILEPSIHRPPLLMLQYFKIK